MAENLVEFLGNQKIYQKNSEWEVKGTYTLKEEEKECFERAEVTKGDYGLSVCFIIKPVNPDTKDEDKKRMYVSLDLASNLEEGDEADLNSVEFRKYVNKRTGQEANKCMAYIKEDAVKDAEVPEALKGLAAMFGVK